MKGLILKDLYTIKGYFKQYILVLGIMIVWSVFMKTSSFLSMYAILLGGMLVLTTMSTDEMVHFDRYALTMPVSIKTIIKAKYAILLLFIGLGIFLGALFEWIGRTLPILEGNKGWEWQSLVLIATVFLITYDITFPILFKLGIEKARFVYIAVMMVLGAAMYGAIKLFGMEDVQLAGSGLAGIKTFGILVLINAAALWVSYRASLMAVKNREW